MPLSIAFRWKAPRIETPREDPNGIAGGLSAIGDSIYRVKQSRRAEDERQRRIAEEDRQKSLFGETADLIRGKADDRARLVQRREQIVRQIAAIKQRIGM